VSIQKSDKKECQFIAAAMALQKVSLLHIPKLTALDED
jgi:hypothetical protein